VILAIVAAAGFALFLVWELTEKHPVVDLRLFGQRNFWTGTVAISLGYGVYFGNLVLLPLWLQQYMGYTATLAGMVLAPVGLLAILLTPVVGRTLNKVDPRIFATASFVVFALVLYMRAHFNTDADFDTLMVPTLDTRRGDGAVFRAAHHHGHVRPDAGAHPGASGLINFVRITAGSFGTSITTTWWDRRASLHHAQLTEHITSFDSSSGIANLQAQGFSPEQSHALLNRLVDQQAFMLSFQRYFLRLGRHHAGADCGGVARAPRKRQGGRGCGGGSPLTPREKGKVKRRVPQCGRPSSSRVLLGFLQLLRLLIGLNQALLGQLLDTSSPHHLIVTRLTTTTHTYLPLLNG